MAHVPPEQDESQSPSTLHQQQQQLTPTHTTTETTHVAERRGLTNSNDLHITIPQPPITTTTATPTAPLITNSPTSFTHSDVANDPEKQQPQDRPSPARSLSRPLFEPLRNRPQARQTFAEGMNHGIQSLRRTVFNRTHSTKNDSNEDEEAGLAATTTATSSANKAPARPVMPRSRPSMTQFKMREQPAKMIIPPPYGQEKVQEAAKALAAGIPDGIPHGGASHLPPLTKVMTPDSETSDDEPEVRVHFEIHLQEDADSEPICPLSEQNVNTLATELELTAEERSEVQAIQNKEDLTAYFAKLPRDYDVQIIVSDGVPDLRFAQDDYVMNGETIAVVRRESISSIAKEKRSGRRKQRYRRPTTDLTLMPVEEPKASWLELFYDLLFVANLTEFTHSHPITGHRALANYIGWFIIMWWAWAGQTFWAARFDMDDLFTKLCKLIEFCALITFGAFSSDHLDRTSTGFIGSYIVLKGVLAIEYGNVLFWAIRNRSKKSLTPLLLQIGSNLLAMVVWGLSILSHNTTVRYIMWYSTIVIEVAVLVSFGRRTSVTFAGSHLPERFALFTIIVLGENIIGLIGLSAGASTWTAGLDLFMVLFVLMTIILYALWWLYFDDFSEDIFHKTTTLSQLWAYLHLPLHICLVLVGTGALDLIRLYKLEHHINEITTEAAHMIKGNFDPLTASALSALSFTTPTLASGFEVPIERKSAAASGAAALSGRDTDYDLTKQYFLVVCSLVFLCNSLLKWINLRSYDKFQKIVYLSRFLNAIFILCLLAVPLDKMTPFALLGSMAFFCILQVAVDLAVIYFGAYGFVDDLGAWARSARSSIDLGSFLPSPLAGRSRANSRVQSRVGSTVNLGLPPIPSVGHNHKGATTKHHFQRSNSGASSLAITIPFGPGSPPHSPNRDHHYHHNHSHNQQFQQYQNQISLQQQSPTLSQQQQQALYNMHVNANSLGASGAYGNLVQALAEIKRREHLNHPAAGPNGVSHPYRQISLSAGGFEHGSGTIQPIPRRSIGDGRMYIQQNSVSLKRPGTNGGTPRSSIMSTPQHGQGSSLDSTTTLASKNASPNGNGSTPTLNRGGSASRNGDSTPTSATATATATATGTSTAGTGRNALGLVNLFKPPTHSGDSTPSSSSST
ncbi:MAG: bacterial low temperature requirement A protein-domain-containing protein [Linnemannia elongata]|nr:MAG: bacterial low temperature requirement A protein-domain-containing protein [Linnemannia elongata]